MTTFFARALPIALALAATVATAAEQHDVFLVEGGFFPETIYASAGDTLNFINTTEVAENVIAADGSWQTSQIPSQGSEIVAISADMHLIFNYDEGSEAPKVGAISFDPAPVN